MIGENTNSKKIIKIYKKMFDEQFIKIYDEFDDITEYIQFLKDEIFDEISPQLRVLWEGIEYIFQLKLDLPITDLVEFHFLNFVYNGLMEPIIFFEDEEFEDDFIADFEKVKDSNDENRVKELMEKYKTIIYYELKKNDELGIYETFEKVEPEVKYKIDLLKRKVDSGAYNFIHKVDYLRLENLIILHLILRSFLKRILPDLKNSIAYEKSRVEKITDSKFLKIIKESKFPELQSALIMEKNNLIPLRLTELFDLSQDDLFRLLTYFFKVIENLNTDIVLVYLKDSFEFNKMNKEKLAEILYSFMDILFEYDSDIEILSRDEWRDYQEKKGLTPGEDNRAWRTYMIRQVEKFIPFFDDWVKSA